MRPREMRSELASLAALSVPPRQEPSGTGAIGYLLKDRISDIDTNAGIAERLVITEGAVERHTQRLFARLGLHDDVHRRVSAVVMLLHS